MCQMSETKQAVTVMGCRYAGRMFARSDVGGRGECGVRGRRGRGWRRQVLGGPPVGVGVGVSTEDAEVNRPSDAAGKDVRI